MKSTGGGTTGGHVTGALQLLLDGVVLVLSSWTLYCYILGWLGADYRLLFAMAWLPLALALWPILRLSGLVAETAAEAGQATARRRLILGGGAVAAVVGVYLLSGSFIAFWVLAVVVLAVDLRLRPNQAVAGIVPTVPERTGVVVLLCVVALIVTLVAHRPDADDSFYLSVVVDAQDHPERPILSCDDMHGEPGLPLLETAHRLRSYELLVASLSHWSGVPAKVFYYLLFPSLFAILTVAAHWLTLREIGGSYAWLGTSVVVIALLSWGDVHPAFGNFAFVRLFQGKAILVSVFVPAAVLFASRFARDRTWRNWLLLAAVQIAALGISPSAVVVAPLASAAYLIAAAPDSRGPKLIGEGLLASAVVVVAGAMAFAAMRVEGTVPASAAGVWELVGHTGTAMDSVLGLPARKAFALFAILFVPFLGAPTGRNRMLGRYVFVLFLVVMNPLLNGTLGVVAERLEWRVFWAVPFPLLLGVLAQRIAVVGVPSGRIAWAGAAIVAVVFALVPGTWTVSPENGTRLGFPDFKVDPEHAVARSIVEQTDVDDLVLAPVEIAQWLPTFPRHPRLVAVRPQYLHVTGKATWSEVQERRLLMRLVTYDWFSLNRVARAGELIEKRRVTMVVLSADAPVRDLLVAELGELDCRPVDIDVPADVPPYEAWRCPVR